MSRRAQPIATNKEDANFREALKLYESKQHRKALKLCDQVLKKNSHYSEALALKALLLHSLKEDDSELYITKALAASKNSPVSNHILGILRRQELKYADAAVYFKAALDNGSSNMQIWRDLSTMQMQTRDYSQLVHSRLKYLDNFLGYRANWTSLAIAHHLTSNYEAAEKTLNKFEDLAKGKLGDAEMYEHSELLMYKNEIIGEIDVERALRELEELDTFDKTGQLELRAKYLMKLDRKSDAQRLYRQLLKRNPDNETYYHQLEQALETTEKSEEVRDKLYTKLATFYPRSDPVKSIPLNFTTGELFQQRAKDYVVGLLKRCVPAAFTNVKPLYKNSEKANVIGQIVEEFYPTAAEVSPLCWVWTTYFLAQHHLITGNLTKARELIESAIEHTPTLVELYILKARIYKHLGDSATAAEIMNGGRLLDLQDRFINSKCVKYYLRNNDVAKATEVASLFTKNDNEENGLKDLHAMQVTWFIIENAESYARLYRANIDKDADLAKKYAGLALKRFHAIVQVFDEYWNDQIDFHTFCMRKGTARSYVDMIRWEDEIFNSPVYCRAVEGAFQLYSEYVKHVKPEENESPVKNDKKAKKEKAAKMKALQSEKSALAAYENDEDVFGESLIGGMDVFESKFFTHSDLNTLSLNEIQFQIQFDKGKMAQCLQALGKLIKLSADTYPLTAAHILKLKYGTEGREPLVKMLATKGVEKYFSEWDHPEKLIEKYCTQDAVGVKGLVALYQLQLEQLDNDTIKQQILETAASLDPIDQLAVMSSL